MFFASVGKQTFFFKEIPDPPENQMVRLTHNNLNNMTCMKLNIYKRIKIFFTMF